MVWFGRFWWFGFLGGDLEVGRYMGSEMGLLGEFFQPFRALVGFALQGVEATNRRRRK